MAPFSGACVIGIRNSDKQKTVLPVCEGATPVDADMYYGFTRFAVELNEIDELQRHLYAPTDTRFRPDQRYINSNCNTNIWYL